MPKVYPGWKFVEEESAEFNMSRFVAIMNARFDFGGPDAKRPKGPCVDKPEVPATFRPFMFETDGGSSERLLFLGKIIYDSDDDDQDPDTEEEWLSVLRPRIAELLGFVHLVTMDELL